MKWYNDSTGVIASCEQMEPVLLNGRVQRGTLRRTSQGEVFDHDEKGIDILHRVIPGQIQVEDDDPRLLAYLRSRERSVDQRVDDFMNSPIVAAINAAINTNGQADARMRAVLSQIFSRDQN